MVRPQKTLINHWEASGYSISISIPMLSLLPPCPKKRNTVVNVGPAPNHPENQDWKTITFLLLEEAGLGVPRAPLRATLCQC